MCFWRLKVIIQMVQMDKFVSAATEKIQDCFFNTSDNLCMLTATMEMPNG